MNKNFGRRRKKRIINTIPITQDDVKQAISDYLNRGGKIQKITVNNSTYKDFVRIPVDTTSNSDSFLNGCHI